MQEKLTKLKNELQTTLDNDGIIVDDVTYECKGNYNFLTITLDKIGGIDIEMIVQATNAIDSIVDKAKITNEKFIIDVVSKERGNNE